jgi:hypothetical protein
MLDNQKMDQFKGHQSSKYQNRLAIPIIFSRFRLILLADEFPETFCYWSHLELADFRNNPSCSDIGRNLVIRILIYYIYFLLL